MRPEETTARALVAQLTTAGVRARVEGAGVHWQVKVEPVGTRAMRVHCFWYEAHISGLLLGMNRANQRSRLGSQRAPRAPYAGPEYLVILEADRAQRVDGRTRTAEDVVACARAWLAGLELEQLVAEVPFVDARHRAMRARAKQLDPRLRWEIGRDPSYELWVYGDGRSCELMPAEDDGVSCSFLLGQAQVAHGADLDDLPAAVAAWLIAALPLRGLADRVDGVQLERHAEVLESDPARWHWLHLLDRAADPNDVLRPQRALIEALALNPVVSSFYSYSSLDRLCFSASSHYPWVGKGLPHVTATDGGGYLVDGERTDLGRAEQLIEAKLAAAPVRPFFGSAPHHELSALAECLAQQGSALRPQLVQSGRWFALKVTDQAGAKQCRLDGASVQFIDASGRLSARWSTLEHAVRAVRRFCESGASRDAIAVDRTRADR